MNVLVLDDDPARHAKFEQNLAARGHRVVHAWTCDDAFLALRSQPPFDVAFLDHDLVLSGSKVAGKYCPGSGVSNFIAAMPAARRPKRVVVHSYNVIAAVAMVERLRKAGVATTYEPFAFLWQ